MITADISALILEAARVYLYMRFFRTCIGACRVSKKMAALLWTLFWTLDAPLLFYAASRQFYASAATHCTAEMLLLFLMCFFYQGNLPRRMLAALLLPAVYWSGLKMLLAVLLHTTNPLDVKNSGYLVCAAFSVAALGLLEAVVERIWKSRQELELALLQQEIRFYENQFEIIRQSQNQVRAFKHDMKHHLNLLSDMISRGETQKASAYLEEMGAFMENRKEYVSTGNENIDSILNYKIAEARSLGARVSLDIRIPERFDISAFDLNIILSNLLDNALHALPQAAAPALSVQITYSRGILYIHIQNNCAGRNRTPDKGHGLGLKNVQKTAEKYNGSLTVTQTPAQTPGESEFHAGVLLYVSNLSDTGCPSGSG